MISLDRFTAYLCLLRLMFLLRVTWRCRMSMKEFEEYEEKILKSNVAES